MSAGERVAAGRLRVDAARAVDKLREYQLPDPRLWVLEVVRAAVAAGAREVHVSGDADDVRVAWTGPPLDAHELPRLFDELVDPAPRADRRHLRLLGTGVNTALALDPRWVDVFALDGEGGASRVRFTARLLEVGAEGASERLRALAAERVTPPSEAPASGGLVHLRRLPQWDAIPLLVGYGEPRELTIARRCCDDLPVPITVGQARLGIERSHADLLRLRLGEGLDGFVALMEPSAARAEATLDVAEHGVVLARYTWPIAGLEGALGPVPLRLYVSSARMPTNASRSGVRVDEAPVAQALERAAELLPELIARVRRELSDDAEHAWEGVARERLRAASIALLAARCAGRGWRAGARGDAADAPLPRWLAPLAEEPLLRDALGRPRSARSFAPLGAEEELVHFGADPVEDWLEPWLGDALWIPPGDPARYLLGARWSPRPAEKLAKQARRYQDRRARFWASPPREASLAATRHAWIVGPIGRLRRSRRSLLWKARAEPPGLTGELALGPADGEGATLTVLVEGREIERVALSSPLAFTAVASCEGLTPRYDFRAVRRDHVFAELLRAVEDAALRAAESLAARMLGPDEPWDDRAVLGFAPDALDDPRTREAVARVLRRALSLAHAILGEDAAKTLGASRSPLARAPIWPTARGDATDTRTLIKAASTRPVGYLDPRITLRWLPLGPPVLWMGAQELALARALVGPDALMDYRPGATAVGRGHGDRASAERLRPTHGVALELRPSPDVRVALAWGKPAGAVSLVHWGCVIEKMDHEAVVATQIVIEDGRLVPDPTFRGLARPAPDDYDLDGWIRQLARAYVDALSGAAPEGLALGGPPGDARDARGALLSAIARVENLEAWLGRKRLRDLTRVPLFERLGTTELISVAELTREDGPIRWVPALQTGSAGAGFHPVRAHPDERDALARLTGRPLVDVTPEVEERRRDARREVLVRRLRANAPVDPTTEWRGTIVEVKGRSFTFGRAALPPRRSPGEVTVLIEGRHYLTRAEPDGPPVRVCFDRGLDAADDSLVGLSTIGERSATFALAEAQRVLLMYFAVNEPGALLGSPEVFRLLHHWATGLRQVRAREQKILDAIAAAPAFVAVQGGRTSIAEAASGSTLRVARWDEAWLGPAEGERPSAYDRPVLSLPSVASQREELRAALGGLFRGRVVDVTPALERLQTSRRVSHGLAEVPRLAEVADRRFRYALDDLLADAGSAAARTDLGVGEAALADDERTRVSLLGRAKNPVVLELNLIPRIHLIALTPLLRRRATLDDEARERVERAVKVVTGKVLRRVVDDTPPAELPRWVRGALRESSLRGGGEFLERLLDVPMFETTVGEWVTPAQLREEATRHGQVWTTPDPRPLRPDRDRLAVRLSADERERLSVWAPAVDATEELELDEARRANRQRPPAESREPTEEERGAALEVVRLRATEDDPLEGTITVLAPGRARLRGLYLSVGLHPFDVQPDPSSWPCVARLEHPGLAPDRTWAGPSRNPALEAVEARVRSEVWRALAQLLPYPKGATISVRVRPGTSGQARTPAAEGVAWLELTGEAGEVDVVDARGARRGPTEGLPVSATLWFPEPASDDVVRAAVRGAYRHLLSRAADRVRAGTLADPERVLAALLGAARRAVELTGPVVESIELTVFHPPRSLGQVLADARNGGTIAVCAPGEEARASEVAGGGPLLVHDEGPVSEAVLRAFEGRAVHWSERLAEAVLGSDEAMRPRRAAPPVPRAIARADLEVRAPESPLEAALAERLGALRLAGAESARVDASRKRPLATLEDGCLVFAGLHPAVSAVTEAVGGRHPDAGALVRLLLARAAGALARDHGRVGVPGHLAAMTSLLEPAD